MGGSNWSTDHYEDRARVRAVSNTPVFKHHDDVKTGKVTTALHAALDPSKLKNNIREARDSAAHPNSVPIIFGLDVTGSMHTVPGVIQSKLGQLMTTLLTKGILADPQICFCAIGDSDTDKVPLQIKAFLQASLLPAMKQRPQDAWDLELYLKTLLEGVVGKPKYRPLAMPKAS